MSFLLAADGRDDDAEGAFQRYQAYLDATKSRFPASAYALATSDWWFNFHDHRCPHDAWIERIELIEAREGPRKPSRLTLCVRLLGAYHDGNIELHYPDVTAYTLSMQSGGGHRDWRYDELRVSDAGRLIHEIEWWAAGQTGHWLIEAADLEYQWIPFEGRP